MVCVVVEKQALNPNKYDQVLSDSDRRTVASEFFFDESEGWM